MKKSPCCKADIIKRKIYGGQIVAEYCKRCNRRVWGGRRRVTRDEMYRRHGQVMEKLNKKSKKTEKLLDVLTEVLIEKHDANFE